MTAEEIVRALAVANPNVHSSGMWHSCGLCDATLPIYLEDHREGCVWRQAVEWIKDNPEIVVLYANGQERDQDQNRRLRKAWLVGVVLEDGTVRVLKERDNNLVRMTRDEWDESASAVLADWEAVRDRR